MQDVNADTTMLDLFLESFWLGDGTRELLDHLVLVAVDQTAYDRCRFLRLNCYRLETDGVDFGGEKLYMSPEFIKMMWRRTWFLLEVLKRGYSFVFTVSFWFSCLLSSFFMQYLYSQSWQNCRLCYLLYIYTTVDILGSRSKIISLRNVHVPSI